MTISFDGKHFDALGQRLQTFPKLVFLVWEPRLERMKGKRCGSLNWSLTRFGFHGSCGVCTNELEK
jgi:hypothetical protein